MPHMRTEAPPLLPIFRSAVQARLLLHVLTADEPLTAADLARELDAPEATVSREARRLLDAGLLDGRRVGRATELRPAADNPATAPLRQLLVVTLGPARLLEQAMADVPGIDAAFVHGSWAARYHGEPGPPPADIDVAVVGSATLKAVRAACRSLEATIGREVNPVVLSRSEWENDDDGFTATVREGPLVPVPIAAQVS